MKKDWEIKKLGEVCEIQRGLTYSKKDEVNSSNNIVLRSSNINLENHLIDLSELKYLRNDFIIKDIHRIKKGSLLICLSSGSKTHLGKVALVDNDYNYSFGGFIGQITPLEIVNSKYLFHNLTSKVYSEYILSLTDGLNINNLKIKDLKDFPIPIPPLAEQERIVAILDEVFASIEKAKTNTEKNIQNAKEVFESSLNKIFTNPKENWEEKKLGEVCEVKRGSSPRPIKKYLTQKDDGVNWIKIGDTKNIKKYIYKTKEKITKEGAKKSRYVQEGDFILSNSMSFGKPFIMKTDGYIHDGWFVLKLNNNINSNYFYELLSSKYIQNQFTNLSSGAIVKNISSDLTKKAKLPIPPISEQKQIVEKLDKLKAETDKLEEIYTNKIAKLEELKKSILKKAFEGEL